MSSSSAWGLLAIVGVVVVMAANVLVVFVARLGVARLVGLCGVRFFPNKCLGAPLARSKQALCLVVSLVAAYAFPAVLFASSLLSGGRVVTPPPEERGTRVQVMPGKPADAAGVRDGDRFVSIAGKPVMRWDELAAAIQSHAGETIAAVVERDSKHVTFDVDVPNGGRIGVQLAVETTSVGFFEALATGLQIPASVAYAVVTGLIRRLFGSLQTELGGPIMIVRETAFGAQPSLANWLYRVAVLDCYYGLPLAFLMAFAIRVRRQPA